MPVLVCVCGCRTPDLTIIDCPDCGAVMGETTEPAYVAWNDCPHGVTDVRNCLTCTCRPVTGLATAHEAEASYQAACDANDAARVARWTSTGQAAMRRVHVAAHQGHPITDCPLCQAIRERAS